MKFTSNLYASVNTMQANQRTEFRKFENLDLALETETEAGIYTHHNISINCLASSQPARLSFTTTTIYDTFPKYLHLQE